MTTQSQTLRNIATWLREMKVNSVMKETQARLDEYINALDIAVQGADLEDPELFLPLNFVITQQKGLEAQIAVLEYKLSAMTQARDDAVQAAHIAAGSAPTNGYSGVPGFSPDCSAKGAEGL